MILNNNERFIQISKKGTKMKRLEVQLINVMVYFCEVIDPAKLFSEKMNNKRFKKQLNSLKRKKTCF